MTSVPYPKVDDRAPCRHGDPDRFFQPGQLNEDVLAECDGCPFVDPCLAYALRHAVIGIWGGTSAGQRARIRRERGIVPEPVQFGRVASEARCGTYSGYAGHYSRLEEPCQQCREAARAYQRERHQRRKAASA